VIGYWQAALKISEVFLQFFGVLLANFVLPNLSAARGRASVVRELRSAYWFIIPTFLGGAAAIYGGKHLIVRWVLTPQYSAMSDYLGLQLAGDFARLLGAVPGYLLLALGRIRLYVVSEMTQFILFVAVASVCAVTAGRLAPVYAYAIAQTGYLAIAFLVLKRTIASVDSIAPRIPSS
jgi:hypothetical protein